MVKSTKTLTKHQKSELLKKWWTNLPKGIQLYVRDEIVKGCGITIYVWYHWIKGNSEIPVLVLPVIERIAQESIFGATKQPHRAQKIFKI